MRRTAGSNTVRADNDYEALAQAIKSIYYDVLSQVKKIRVKRDDPHWDGGTDKYGIHRKSVWIKIVDFLQKNQITNYVGYICNSILFYSSGKFYPNHLLSENAIKAFREAEASASETFKTNFKRAIATLRTRAANFLLLGDSPQEALQKAYLSCLPAFDPVVRAALAMIYSIPDFNSDDRALARIYYSICPDCYETQVPGLGEFLGYQKIYLPSLGGGNP